mgnify:CR=1 FL=1
MLNRKKKGPKDVLEKIRSSILELRHSEMPESLGRYMKRELAGTLSHDVTHSSRILYQVRRTERGCRVTLLRVCNHKNVYGKD